MADLIKKAALVCGAEQSRPDDHICVPLELCEQVRSWVLWKHTNDGRKMPDDWTYTPGAKYKAANDPALHLPFDEAVAKQLTRTGIAGLGLYLSNGIPLTVNGCEGWLWVLDLDGFAKVDGNNASWDPDAVDLWNAAGQTYIEVSPSGTGLKLFFVSDKPPVSKFVYSFGTGQFATSSPNVKKYQQREVEVFTSDYFVTVTGQHAKGDLQFIDEDGTCAVMRWLDQHGVKKTIGTPALTPLGFEVPAYIRQLGVDETSRNLLGVAYMHETDANIEQVQAYLDAVDADCGYEEWRNIVWAVASLGWDCGEELAKQWSMTAQHRYNEVAFNRTWRSYKPGGISIGTLVKEANNAGYNDFAIAPSATMPHNAPKVQRHDVQPNVSTPTIPAALAATGWVLSQPRFTLSELTADRLFTGAPPVQEWLCEGVFPASKLCVLASPPGVGKSYLALDMACKVASPTKHAMAFGGAIRASGRAIYISAEDDRDEIHRRLLALHPDTRGLNRLHVLSLPDVGHFGIVELDGSKNIVPTDQWRELVKQIKALDDVRLIVVDTFQAMSSGDTNDAAAVQPIMNELSALAATTGATVLILHHVAKGSTKDVKTALDAAEAVRGSGAIVGSARAVYVIWPPSDGGAKLCQAINEPYEEGRVAIGLVAKTNGAAQRQTTYFLRGSNGLLVDVTQRYTSSAAANEQALLGLLVQQIDKHAQNGCHFAASQGNNGLHGRRHELPTDLQDKTRDWFQWAVGELIRTGKITRITAKGGAKLAVLDG